MMDVIFNNIFFNQNDMQKLYSLSYFFIRKNSFTNFIIILDL